MKKSLHSYLIHMIANNQSYFIVRMQANINIEKVDRVLSGC